jgi:hypothetical protein
MANANWSNPTLTSTYTNFVSEVKNRDEDLALQFDGTTSTNIPTGTIRWDSSANRWKKWSGSAWGELTSTYALTGLSTTGNAAIGGITTHPAGSATAGSIQVGTGTTYAPGIYSPGTDQLAISTNGTGRLFVDASGRVGLGASSGGDLLQVGNSTNRGTVSVVGTSSSTPYIKLDYTAAASGRTYGLLSGSSANGNFDIYDFTASAYRLTIDSSGRLGLGTTSPGGALDVLTSSGDSYVRVRRSTPAQGQAGFTVGGGTSGTDWSIYQPASSNDIRFYGNSSDRLTIDSSGRVGIGTTSPATPLHVIGNITVSSGSGVYLGAGSEQYITSSGSPSSTSLVFQRWTGAAYVESVRIDSSGRLLVGTSSTSAGAAGAVVFSGGDPGGNNSFMVLASKSATPADGEDLGIISFNDSAHIYNNALIRATRDGGTWTATTSKPTRLTFSTTASGFASPTERLRITSTGAISPGSSGTNTGTTGQVLISQGSSSSPTWGSSIVSGTAVASTSGTSIDFTGIPSWVKRVTVMFNGVSTNGASNFLVQLGTSGGIVSTGYTSTSVATNNAGGGTTSSTAGYVMRSIGAAGALIGHMTITNVSGNTWVSSHVADTQASGVVEFGGGTIALAAVLTTVRITSVTPDTFDAGSINILYE